MNNEIDDIIKELNPLDLNISNKSSRLIMHFKEGGFIEVFENLIKIKSMVNQKVYIFNDKEFFKKNLISYDAFNLLFLLNIYKGNNEIIIKLGLNNDDQILCNRIFDLVLAKTKDNERNCNNNCNF